MTLPDGTFVPVAGADQGTGWWPQPGVDAAQRRSDMYTQGRAVLIDEAAGRAVVEAATAAPSIQNSQPWQFAVGPRRIELYAEPQRHMRIADGNGRSLLVSCGAALFNARVALDHFGFHPQVQLLPSDDPTLVARLDVDHRHTRPGLLEVLYPAIARRRANRGPFHRSSVRISTMSRLVEAAGQENATLQFYDDPLETRQTVGAVSTKGDAPLDWVRAGQALQRVLLEATVADVAASLMTQPLAQPVLGRLIPRPGTEVGNTQVLMRLGYGVPAPATPRRPITEMIRRPHEEISIQGGS